MKAAVKATRRRGRKSKKECPGRQNDKIIDSIQHNRGDFVCMESDFFVILQSQKRKQRMLMQRKHDFEKIFRKKSRESLLN